MSEASDPQVIITPDEETKDFDPWRDAKEANEAINECLQSLHKRLEAIEKYLEELPTPDKTYYKPKDYPDYLNIKGNYDEIYRRLTELEAMSHKAPSTDHGKRLTALEEKLDDRV